MNEQITKEYYSAYLYLAMVSYFEGTSLSGFASWMRMQVQEELFHGTKLFNYMHERGETVVLAAIDVPPAKYSSPEEVFQKTLEHEQLVTKSINDLYAVARDVNDNACMSFLQWFIDEQVEEENNVGDVLGKLKLANNQAAGILFLDKELGARPQPTFATQG